MLKQFVQYNYALNMQSNTSLRIVWPLVAFMSDSIVMWKKLHPSGRFVMQYPFLLCCKCISWSIKISERERERGPQGEARKGMFIARSHSQAGWGSMLIVFATCSIYYYMNNN